MTDDLHTLRACAVTLTSALIALVIASVESLAVLASTMHWKGKFWTLMVNAPFEVLGYLIIGDLCARSHVYYTQYPCLRWVLSCGLCLHLVSHC